MVFESHASFQLTVTKNFSLVETVKNWDWTEYEAIRAWWYPNLHWRLCLGCASDRHHHNLSCPAWFPELWVACCDGGSLRLAGLADPAFGLFGALTAPGTGKKGLCDISPAPWKTGDVTADSLIGAAESQSRQIWNWNMTASLVQC